jgi:hypothetical protein
MTPTWKVASSGAVVSLLFGVGGALAPDVVAAPFPQGCGGFFEARCDAPPPAPQGPVQGGYFWKSERDGPYYYCPPICTNDQIPH